jgi:hypothetical protein
MAYYQQQAGDPQNLQFYQSNYANAYQQAPAAGVAPSVAGLLGAMDSSFGANINVGGAMGSAGELTPGLLAAFGTGGYANEPPLLEELGVNFLHIKLKTLAVLNPFNKRAMNTLADYVMPDADLAGPILFVLLFGTLLLLAGKVQFGYIYGVGLFGTVSLHYLFKLMSLEVYIDLARLALVIGYCLLPLVFVSVVGVFVTLDNLAGYVLSAVAVCWCTYLALGFFVLVLKLHNVRPLIAYPLAMFYSVFALMAIFVEKEV